MYSSLNFQCVCYSFVTVIYSNVVLNVCCFFITLRTGLLHKVGSQVHLGNVKPQVVCAICGNVAKEKVAAAAVVEVCL